MDNEMQSSRMLSISSNSASSSSTCEEEKKLVGGICLGSPTTTNALPRAIAPTASLVGICDASSKITRSNFSASRSIYWATDIGLINMHGHSLGNRVGIWSIILRIDVPRPPFEMFLFRIPISELEAASIVSDGILAANLQYSSFLLNSWKSIVSCLYLLIISSNSNPLKRRKVSSASTVFRANWW